MPYRKVSCAVWLLEVAAQRDLGEGRSQQALEKCLCLLRTADHCYQQTHDVDFRRALRCERAALQMLRHLLMEGRLSLQDVQRIARRLPTAADTWHQDTTRLLAFDELRFAQFLAPIYEINREGKIRFAASFRRLGEGKPQEDSFTRGRAWRLYWLMNMPLSPEGVWELARKESAALASFLQQGPASCAAHANDEPPFRPSSRFHGPAPSRTSHVGGLTTGALPSTNMRISPSTMQSKWPSVAERGWSLVCAAIVTLTVLAWDA